MTIMYDSEEDAREAWDAEREAFGRDGEEADLPEEMEGEELCPPRFWVDEEGGLPAVRDRVYSNQVVARFITLKAAGRYRQLREHGMGHGPAMLQIEESLRAVGV